MNSRLETIREICVRNELGFLDVMRIYSKFNNRVYFQSIKKGENFLLYNPILEERTLRLTERYFDIKKVKELKNMRY